MGLLANYIMPGGDFLGINDLNIVDGTRPIADALTQYIPGGGLLNVGLNLASGQDFNTAMQDIDSGLIGGSINTAGNILGGLANTVAGAIGIGGTEDEQPINGLQPIPVTGGSCPLPDCYSRCRANDEAKAAICKELNARHVAALKQLGCSGVVCKSKSAAKTCRYTGKKPVVIKRLRKSSCGCG